MLKRVWSGIGVGLILLGLLAAPATARAQANDAETVIRSIVKALNDGDIDTALALVADDAVITLFPAPPGTTGVFAGKDEIRSWWETFTAAHGSADFTSFSAQGNTAVWTAEVADDGLRGLGLNTVAFVGVGIVQGGLLKGYVWSMTDSALASVATAAARAHNAQVAQRYMEELWNQGNVEIADELLAPMFVDHTPRPGMGADREGLKQDVIGFHKQFPNQNAQFRVDDLIATENRVVVRGTLMMPSAAGSTTPSEGPGFVTILGLKDGQITERWATFISWGQ